MTYPNTNAKRRQELQSIRQQLAKCQYARGKW
jgi:hypothetical protein